MTFASKSCVSYLRKSEFLVSRIKENLNVSFRELTMGQRSYSREIVSASYQKKLAKTKDNNLKDLNSLVIPVVRLVTPTAEYLIIQDKHHAMISFLYVLGGDTRFNIEIQQTIRTKESDYQAYLYLLEKGLLWDEPKTVDYHKIRPRAFKFSEPLDWPQAHYILRDNNFRFFIKGVLEQSRIKSKNYNAFFQLRLIDFLKSEGLVPLEFYKESFNESKQAKWTNYFSDLLKSNKKVKAFLKEERIKRVKE